MNIADNTRWRSNPVQYLFYLRGGKPCEKKIANDDHSFKTNGNLRTYLQKIDGWHGLPLDHPDRRARKPLVDHHPRLESAMAHQYIDSIVSKCSQ